MSKKQFFATISMQDPANLRPLFYVNDIKKEIFTQKCTHPSIPLIGWNVKPGDEVEIVTLRTDDSNGRTDANYETFKAELASLSENCGVKLEIGKEIVIPLNESREKHVQLFRDVIGSYSESADIYMDVTYGTKATPVLLFSSLAYAENAMNCNIKSVSYGNYRFDGSDEGAFYDVRCLYEINMLIQSMDDCSPEKFSGLMNTIWG